MSHRDEMIRAAREQRLYMVRIEINGRFVPGAEVFVSATGVANQELQQRLWRLIQHWQHDEDVVVTGVNQRPSDKEPES